jgi:polar amino acid transport system substrate-binding protein
MTIRFRLLVPIAALSLLIAGCATPSDTATRTAISGLAPMPTAPPSPTTTSVTTDCTASLRPTGPLPRPGSMPKGSTMERIVQHGSLVVGVDQTTLLFGYRDPITGELQGFDIDVAHEIAHAIFGDPNAIEFHALTSTARIAAIKAGTVDMVVSAFSMACSRWKDMDFSSVYYDAHQALMVKAGSNILGVSDLDGKTVCVTANSTSESNIKDLLKAANVTATIDEVSSRADCLVDLQEGKADAITSDDTILAGFRLQDPLTQILDHPLHDEPYGIAIPKNKQDFVRFVNGVLEQMRADGRWQALDEEWLSSLGPVQSPPTPTYSD